MSVIKRKNGVLMKRSGNCLVIGCLGVLILFIFIYIISNFSTNYSSKNTETAATQGDKYDNKSKIIPTKAIKQKAKSYASKYRLTKYKHRQSSENWVFVYVNPNANEEEVLNIAKELHSKYPNTCFELYNSMKTIKKMYSYQTRKTQFPEKDFYKNYAGTINQQFIMEDVWKWSYTSKNFETIELE